VPGTGINIGRNRVHIPGTKKCAGIGKHDAGKKIHVAGMGIDLAGIVRNVAKNRMGWLLLLIFCN
jgi:hypothetical protein